MKFKEHCIIKNYNKIKRMKILPLDCFIGTLFTNTGAADAAVWESLTERLPMHPL
jgi:hypothetical protein